MHEHLCVNRFVSIAISQAIKSREYRTMGHVGDCEKSYKVSMILMSPTHTQKLICPLRSSHFLRLIKIIQDLYDDSVEITGNCMILMAAVLEPKYGTSRGTVVTHYQFNSSSTGRGLS